ncbi:MAG: glycosyltransferase [Odoribacter sp.]
MKSEKILFIYTNMSSFVKEDLKILESQYKVSLFRFKLNKPHQIFISYFQEFFLLLFSIWKYQKIYIWFGDYHTFLPIFFSKITGKKSYLVVGGYDVCRIKELKYGSFKNPIRGFMTKYSMNHCSLNLCVSKYVERKVKWIAPKSSRTLLYNALPTQEITVSAQKKENLILTVGIAYSEKRIILKGFDIFVTIAKNMPEHLFMIVGCDRDVLERVCGKLPLNLSVYPILKKNELTLFYQKAKIYCQFSVIESFSMTLAESMLYNCIPIITNVGGMPEVIGNCGYIVNKKDPEFLMQHIKKAYSDDIREDPHKQILKYFTIQQRANALLHILKSDKSTYTTHN